MASSQFHNFNSNKDDHAAPKTAPLSVEAGDIIVDYLEQIGIEYVFGIPGGAIEPLYSALARSGRRGGPRTVVARHESGAAFMADGYARETGKLGVCCTTAGPGATNMVTGVASAYQDNIPLLVITAQTPLSTFGRGATQESTCTGVNTVEIMRYCTKYSSLISHADQFELKLTSALIAAHQEPTGPAHLSIPLDLLRHPIIYPKARYDIKEMIKPLAFVDDESTKALCRYLENSNKVVLVIGDRCVHAMSTILDLSLLLDASIVTTPQGKGLVSPYHPNYRGVFGVAGHSSATSALRDPNVDVVVAIGTSLDEMTTNGWDESSLMTKQLIHVDTSARFLSRSLMAQYHVCGDLARIFQYVYEHVERARPNLKTQRKPQEPALVEKSNVVRFERRAKERRALKTPRSAASIPNMHDLDRRFGDRRSGSSDCKLFRHFRLDDEHKLHDESEPIKPQRLMYDLSRLFPPNTRYVAEIGNSFMWAIHYLQPLNRRISGKRETNPNLLLIGMGFSSMGWGIGAAVGVALGAPNTPVVCIAGDGSFLMSGQEITAAAQQGLPVIYVILNDAALGTVKYGQRLGGAESIGFELPDINYADMARAMGVNAHTIKSPDDMAALDIKSICTHPGPTLLNVHIDPDEPPPLGERLKMLAAGR